MIRIENVCVHGFEAALRGMRNPMDSWAKADSKFGYEACSDTFCDACPWFAVGCSDPCLVGPADMRLASTLAQGGSDDGKFLRMVTVTMDVTAPLYWWKEFDTYKVGTVANSCSTMHRIHARPFTLGDFSTEHLLDPSLEALEATVEALNQARERFVETRDKAWWWQLVQLLPSSYNQKRTVMVNYEVLRNMRAARRRHKLDEWREFVEWADGLPYVSELGF